MENYNNSNFEYLADEDNMTDAREKLIKELRDIIDRNTDEDGFVYCGDIADFIIQDRKRICDPLVKFKPSNDDAVNIDNIALAILKTLKNAGI